MYVPFKMNEKQIFSSKQLLKIQLSLSVYCKLRSAKCYEMPDASSFYKMFQTITQHSNRGMDIPSLVLDNSVHSLN